MKLEQAARALLAHWDTPAWKYLKPTGDLMADLREALAEQAEQEPVAYTNSDQLGYLKDPLYENAPMAMWSKPFDKHINVSLYAAPVHTKDLTDDEIQKWIDVLMYDPPEWALKRFARAVIAADREKNNGTA